MSNNKIIDNSTTYYLLNAIPSSLLPTEGNSCTITGLSIEQVCDLILELDAYRDYDQTLENNTPPKKLKLMAFSAVGHIPTCLLFAKKLSLTVNAKHNNTLDLIYIPYNRITIPEITINSNISLICGLFSSPRRLAKGERWTEEEIINTNVKWVKVSY